MKKILLFSGLISLLTSCMSTNYYQVYKTEPENLQKVSHALVFEDENCKIVYNLWSEGGNVGFIFVNKTDQTIYVNKAESFFVLNGFSHDYFQNRSFTNSSSIQVTKGKSVSASVSESSASSISDQYSMSITGITLSPYGYLGTLSKGSEYTTSEQLSAAVSSSAFILNSESRGKSVTRMEQPILRIAPKSAGLVTEFIVTSRRFKNCETVRYPKKISSVQFTKEQSPFIFSNRIAYCINQECSKPVFITNSFYVSEISNMTQEQFLERVDTSNCGRKLQTPLYYSRHVAPDQFYIEY